MPKKAEGSATVAGSPKRPWTRVSEAEKSRIVASILNKEITIRKVSIQKNINRRTVTKWVNNAKVTELFDSQKAIEKKALNLRMNNKEIGADESKKCKALMEALQREKLKNEALLAMIEVAEQKFKIKIRKKAGGRQCKSCDKDTQA